MYQVLWVELVVMVGFACLVGTNLVPRRSNLEVGGEEERLVHTVVHVCFNFRKSWKMVIMDIFRVTVM